MGNSSNWQEMKQHAFEAFQDRGKLELKELEQIIRIGCEDGEFDDKEKEVLINIISTMTRADLNDVMWAMVAELIIKFELENDRDATIEELEDPEEL